MFAIFRQAVAAFAGLLLFLTVPLMAGAVTLKSADGTVTLTGKLLGYDGEFYRIKSVFGNITLSALGVTCTGRGCPDPGQYAADLTLSGSSAAINNLLPGLIEDFGFANGLTTLRRDFRKIGWTYFISDPARVPVARIQAAPGTSTSGFSDITNSKSDLIIASRLPNKKEVAAAKKAGIGNIDSRYRQQVLALGALVFLVSPQNPVSALTMDEITRIYSGQITNWAELGGVNAPITLLFGDKHSDLSQMFLKRVFPAGIPYRPKPGREIASQNALSDAVARDPFAIGFTGFGAIRNAKPIAIRGDCGILQTATAFGVKSGDYPLSRSFYIFTPKRRLPVFARDFLAYLKTAGAQTAISNLGFVGLGMAAVPLTAQETRIANAVSQADGDVSLAALKGFVKTFSGAGRLPATFRFKDNSTKIDVRSMRDISTLARMIEVGDFDGRTLIFAGFSDSQGGGVGNLKISRSRAKQVAALVKSRAGRADLSKINFQTIGMGEVAPLACNDTEVGRRINRRVEVWLR